MSNHIKVALFISSLVMVIIVGYTIKDSTYLVESKDFCRFMFCDLPKALIAKYI